MGSGPTQDQGRTTGPLSASEAGNGAGADLRLVQAFLAGDRRAETELGRRLALLPRVLRVLNARAGRPLADEDLLDLAQDAGVALLHKLECFDGRGELDGWIYGICRFEFLNAVRRVRRRPRPVDDFVLEAAAEPSETSLEAERYASDIERGLATLADDERAVVRLKHFDGLTFDAIAARYGISPNTAKTRYYRGLRKLQEFMAPRRKEYRP